MSRIQLRWSITVFALVFLTGSVPAFAQSLSAAEIDEAIKSGLAKKSSQIRLGARDFTLILAGPAQRIQSEALRAATAMTPFTAADVDAEISGPFLRVSAWPDKPSLIGSRWYVVAPAQNIVIFPKGTRDLSKAIQPTSKEAFPQEWGNALGAKFEGQGMTADFDLSTLPAGEFDIVVGCQCPLEARATVKEKDRGKIK